jgi:hypothetical protein
MAVLSDQDRFDLWADYMRDREVGACGTLTKADLRAAVNALDDYLNTNAVVINTAIPQPARGALTAPQKALLLVYVIRQRYLKGA